jgi:hypothetical protein
LNRRNFSNNEHQDRKHGHDNTVTMADKTKKFSKFRRFEDIENMHCIWHPQENHTIGDCCMFIDWYVRKGKTRIKKKITRRKTKTTRKTKVSNSPKASTKTSWLSAASWQQNQPS